MKFIFQFYIILKKKQRIDIKLSFFESTKFESFFIFLGCNLCGNYPGCAGFAYYSQYNYCYFKGVGSGSLRQPYDGMISGTVTNRA